MENCHNKKKYQFIFQEGGYNLFTNPTSFAPEQGVLLEGVPLDRVRAVWLKSDDGKNFLLGDDVVEVRWQRLVKYMLKNEVVWAPTIHLDVLGTGLKFVQGRHRFKWFLDHGYETFTIGVSKHEVARIRNMLDMPPA